MELRTLRWLLVGHASVLAVVLVWGVGNAATGDYSGFASNEVENLGAWILWLGWLVGLVGLWRGAAWGWWGYLVSAAMGALFAAFGSVVEADRVATLLSYLEMLLCGAILVAGFPRGRQLHTGSTFD